MPAPSDDPLSPLDGKGDGKLRRIGVGRAQLRLRLDEEGSILERGPATTLERGPATTLERGPATTLGRGPATARESLAVLIERSWLRDAALLLAYALPEREAVWWASMCVRWACRPIPDAEDAALGAAEAWVRQPVSGVRQALIAAASAAGGTSPAALVARAAYAARLDDPCWTGAGRRLERVVGRLFDLIGADRHDLAGRRFVESGCDVAAGGAGRIRTEPTAA